MLCDEQLLEERMEQLEFPFVHTDQLGIVALCKICHRPSHAGFVEYFDALHTTAFLAEDPITGRVFMLCSEQCARVHGHPKVKLTILLEGVLPLIFEEFAEIHFAVSWK